VVDGWGCASVVGALFDGIVVHGGVSLSFWWFDGLGPFRSVLPIFTRDRVWAIKGGWPGHNGKESERLGGCGDKQL